MINEQIENLYEAIKSLEEAQALVDMALAGDIVNELTFNQIQAVIDDLYSDIDTLQEA